MRAFKDYLNSYMLRRHGWIPAACWDCLVEAQDRPLLDTVVKLSAVEEAAEHHTLRIMDTHDPVACPHRPEDAVLQMAYAYCTCCRP